MRMHLVASALVLMSTGAAAQEAAGTLPGTVGRVAPALEAYSNDSLFGQVWTDEALSGRDRALVTFAALMTRHETGNLGDHAALALDMGVTPAELSETITHLAFYAGWPRVFSALPVAKDVFETRAE